MFDINLKQTKTEDYSKVVPEGDMVVAKLLKCLVHIGVLLASLSVLRQNNISLLVGSPHPEVGRCRHHHSPSRQSQQSRVALHKSGRFRIDLRSKHAEPLGEDERKTPGDGPLGVTANVDHGPRYLEDGGRIASHSEQAGSKDFSGNGGRGEQDNQSDHAAAKGTKDEVTFVADSIRQDAQHDHGHGCAGIWDG